MWRVVEIGSKHPSLLALSILEIMQTLSIKEAVKYLGRSKQIIHYWIGNKTINPASVHIVPIKKFRIEIDKSEIEKIKKQKIICKEK